MANETRGSRRRLRLWGRLKDQGGGTPEPVADASDGLVEDDRIASALRGLSDRDREALQLIGWEELSVKEAATVAGCSENAFAVRLHRARRRLSAALAEIDTVERPALVPMTKRSAWT